MSTHPYGLRLRGLTAVAPPQVVTNDDIARRLRREMERLDEHVRRERGLGLTEEEAHAFLTNDRWIQRHIGFTERRFGPEGSGTIDLAIAAGRLLLTRLDLSPDSIGGIVFASVTPTYRHSPPDAALLQDALGIPAWTDGVPRETVGLDVALACSSWCAALHTAYRHLADADRILLVGADQMSATINWHDRAFACVLGDAGTAALCERVDPAEDWFGTDRFFSWLDGSKAMIIHTPRGGSRKPDLTPEDLRTYQHRLAMDGRQVREDMVPFVGGPALDAALRKAGLTLAELDLLVLHEANRIMNRSVVEQLTARGFRGTVLDAGGRFGNTTSASIPLALALHPDALTVGQTVALVGYGGGYSFRTAIATIRHPFPVWTDL